MPDQISNPIREVNVIQNCAVRKFV